MGTEPRFANRSLPSSGAGGTKIFSKVYGEQVEKSCPQESIIGYPNSSRMPGPLNAEDCPVDAHELLALCAPETCLFIADP